MKQICFLLIWKHFHTKYVRIIQRKCYILGTFFDTDSGSSTLHRNGEFLHPIVTAVRTSDPPCVSLKCCEIVKKWKQCLLIKVTIWFFNFEWLNYGFNFVCYFRHEIYIGKSHRALLSHVLHWSFLFSAELLARLRGEIVNIRHVTLPCMPVGLLQLENHWKNLHGIWCRVVLLNISDSHFFLIK
jgi:hypothetical protein